MNIYNLLNSRSIAHHWEEIEYIPDSLGTAWLVYKNKSLSFDEKCSLWEEIINTMPDAEIPKNEYFSCRFGSLHGFLRRFMELSRRFLDWFYDNAGCVYAVNEGYEVFTFGSVFSSADKIKDYINSGEFEDRKMFLLKRMVIDEFRADEDMGLKPFACIAVNKNIQPVYQSIWDYTGSPCSQEEIELLKAFEGMSFDFPFPFEKGDLLCENTDGLWLRDDEPRLCVYTSLGEYEDMVISGFGQRMNGEIFKSEFLGHCMDYELYSGKCDGKRRIMKALSSYEKGLISDDYFTKLYKFILMEEELKHSIVHYYPEEYFELAGINLHENDGAKLSHCQW